MNAPMNGAPLTAIRKRVVFPSGIRGGLSLTML